jgi:hypothetical protein
MKNLILAQRLQANLLADVRRLSELNDALLEFYESAKLPDTMYCYWKECPDCRAEDKIRRLLKRHR